MRSLGALVRRGTEQPLRSASAATEQPEQPFNARGGRDFFGGESRTASALGERGYRRVERLDGAHGGRGADSPASPPSLCLAKGGARCARPFSAK